MSGAWNRRPKPTRRSRRSAVANPRSASRKKRLQGSSPIEGLEPRLVMAGDIVISEFMATNTNTLADEDGAFSDWIELHNTTASPVDLSGWFLTDNDGDLDQWAFPGGTTIGAGSYMVVFASGKDKRVAGSQLHTNFKLSNDGEYLALIRPNLAVEFEYDDPYPDQEDNISYGIGEGFNTQTLVDTGATGKFHVPTAAVPANWNTAGFNDSSWNTVTTGVGYQNVAGGPNSAPLAYYNFDNNTTDASGNGFNASLVGAATYANDRPSQLGTGQSLSLAGTQAVPQYAMVTGIEELSETEMTVSMWFKGSTTGRGLFSAYAGNGVAGNDRSVWLQGTNIASQLKGGAVAENITSSGKTYTDNAWHHVAYVFKQGQTSQRIFVDGIEVATGATQVSIVTNQDRINIGLAPPALVDPFAGQIDDVAIWNTALSSTQIALLNNGVSPLDLQSYSNDIATNVDGQMDGVNATAYLRMPFNVASLAEYDDLTLRVKYDDGFVAYLNGVEVARRNAPGVAGTPLAFNAAASGNRPNSQATVFEDIDLSAHLGLLTTGTNVLAFQGLNESAGDDDFLLVPKLVDVDSAGVVEQFYTVPTPGGANSSATTQFASDPIFSQTSKVITGSTQVTLTSSTPGAQIYYTTNGTIPTQSSTLYTGPITVNTTTRLRARAFKDDFSPSNVVTNFFTLADAGALGFSSNLPVIVVDTFGQAFNGTTYNNVVAHFLEDPGNRTTLTGQQDIAVRAGMRFRGQSSEGFPKHQYAFETRDENDEDKGYSMLGMPEESDWIIYGPYAEKSHINNALTYELSNEMGDYAVRTQYVEMFINADGTLTSSDYAGLYIFMEKIKRDENRVDIDPMGPNDISGDDLTGGYMFAFDKDDPNGNDKFQTAAVGSGAAAIPAYSFHKIEPDMGTWRPEQTSYLTNYMNQFGTALAGANFADPTTGYAAYIDVQSFINHHLLTEMAKNIDGYRISTYYYKDRNGKVAMGPIWDHNLAWSNANYLTGWDPAGWYADLVGNDQEPYFHRLFQDPNFQQQYIDTWNELREDLWSTERLLQKIDDHTAEIYEAGLRDHARWGTLGTYLWPNIYFGIGDAPHGSPVNNHPARTYRDELQVVRQWVHDRLIWIDRQWLTTPTFNQEGGAIAAGFQLTMTGAAGGTIYYTLDGSDPRLPGGGLNPNAVAYSGPITLNANTKVTARLKNNTVTASLRDDWSAPNQEVFVVDAPDLVLSEIMYNPAIPGVASPYVADDFEYVEVQNAGATPLNLNGYKFTKGISFNFPNVTLNPGQTAVIVRNPAAFASRYPGVTPLGTFTGTLDNNGEEIALIDNIGVALFDGQYEDDWESHTDGVGFSLVTTYQSPGGGTLYQNGDASDKWRASQLTGGNPGAADIGAQAGAIVINEVLNNGADYIELFNTSSSAVNIGGWWLSDSSTNLTKYQIAAGTSIPAGGYLVFTAANDFDSAGDPGALSRFEISEFGETVYLSSPGTGGQAGGYRFEEQVGAAAPGVSTGRYLKTNGKKDFVHLVTSTPGASNSGPVVGPVVISEIMYHPQEHTLWLPVGQIKDEFIEIQNTSASPVNLFDPANPTNTWKFTEGVQFTFPTGQTLAAGERALIVGIDPTAYRTKYSIPAAVKIYGPFTGNLDDGGEQIELQRPGTPVLGDAPYIRVDRVTYDDDAPWSKFADGVGSSLSRTNVNAYGNDSANWQAGHKGGSPGAANTFIDLTPPTAPANVSTSLTGVGTTDPRTNVQWNASTDAESGISHYLIYRKGSLIDPIKAKSFDIGASTGLLFVDNTVFLGPAFQYQVAAVNGDGVEGPKSALGAVQPFAQDDAYTIDEDTTLTTTLAADVPATIFAAGSEWKYLVTATDPGQTWNDETIDESGWGPSSPTQIGYGDGDEATAIGFGPDANNKYPTTYFRKTFTISNLEDYTSFLIKWKRDDGAAIWINGVERVRDALPGNPGDAPTAYSFYTGTAVGDDGNTFIDVPINKDWLKEGLNTIAVEVHQALGNSSDLTFDMSLEGVTPRRTGLLANDNDQGNGPLTAVKLSDPTNGQITQFNANGTFTYVPNPNFNGTDSFTYKVIDSQSNESATATVTITVVPVADESSVAGRHIFYNQSRHDGNNAAAGGADDLAIATDKTALLPGQTATFANVSSYTRGINGLMVDIANLPGTVTAGDFDFKVGNDNTPSGWAALATAPTVTVRPGAGLNGSSRVTLIWPSGTIIKQWLQVTVKANANTGLTAPDVFYYGNAMTESGNGPDFRVTVSDEVAARNNPYSAAANGNVPAPVTNKWDYNRDGNVSVTDQTQARSNQTTVVQALKIITVPSALSGSGLVAQGLGDSDIARGLAASSLTGSSSGTASSQSSGGSSSGAGRLQAQALSAAYAEGESLSGKRRIAAAADELDSDLLELLSSR